MNLLLDSIWIPSGLDLRLFSPELALVGTIVAVLIVPLIAERGNQLIAAVALCGSLATLALNRGVLAEVSHGGMGGFSPPGTPPLLVADSFSVFFKFFIILFLALIIGLWLIGLSARRGQSARTSSHPSAPEFFVLLLTSALGMSLMVSTTHLLVMIIAIETASLPSYAIVASNKRSRAGAEASLKYVSFGAVSSAIMIYGVSLLFGTFGTLSIPAIAAQFTGDPAGVPLLAWIGIVTTGAGICFKISAVPFHFWCPDVFEGAPVEVTTWLSVASKGAGLGLLLRIVHAFASDGQGASAMPLAWGIGIIAAVTCTVGNFAALRQDHVKRILAYSSIAHAGYMMMAAAILLGPVDGPAVVKINSGLSALIAYLLVYLLMNLGAFGVTAMVIWRTGSDHIDNFTGLGRRCLWLALPMSVCLFSLVGLPPLGGFTAKFYLLMALGQAAEQQNWLWSLVIVAVVNTAVSLFYYVRIIRQMFLRDESSTPAVEPPAAGLVMVNACAVMLLLLGTVFFHPLGQRADRFAAHLFNGSGPVHLPPVKVDAAWPGPDAPVFSADAAP